MRKPDSSSSILIVDDIPAFRKFVKSSLDMIEKDFEFYESDNGKDAIELFQKMKPDLVIIDDDMPILGGLEASKEILTLDKSAKIIMISSTGDPHVVTEVNRLSIGYLLVKPVSKYDIAQTVSKFLYRKPAHEPIEEEKLDFTAELSQVVDNAENTNQYA